MQVTAKFMCPEVVGPVKGGAYEVPEGTDAAGLLALARQACGLPVDEGLAGQLLFLRNQRPATGDTVLEEVDTVLFLRKIYGG